jgi:hypothetical protein
VTAIDPLERGGSAAEIPRPGEAELAAPGVELVGMLLKSLGDTSYEVFASLLRDGARGKRRDACGCPVYEWLSTAVVRHLRPDTQVIINDVSTTVGIQVWQPGCSAAFGHARIPEPVQAFINDFDKGYYPELEREA